MKSKERYIVRRNIKITYHEDIKLVYESTVY